MQLILILRIIIKFINSILKIKLYCILYKMANYNPPLENLPIFDNAMFIHADIPITQAAADLRYLRYPNAQGTENLLTINVAGLASMLSGLDVVDGVNKTNIDQSGANIFIDNNVNNGTLIYKANDGAGVETSILSLNSVTGNISTTGTTTLASTDLTLTTFNPPTCSAVQPASNDSTTKIPTTAWVQTAITAHPGANLLTSNNTWTGTQNWSNVSAGSLTSSATQPASNDSTTKIPTTAWVQQAITASIPAGDNLTNVLTVGDNAGGLSITNLNGLTQTGTYNMTGGIIQTDSSYYNQTISTGNSTSISGGGVVNTAGDNSVFMGYNKFIISDVLSGTEELALNKSSISYTNNTGNAEQLIILSDSTDNPILIQSNGATVDGGGITLSTTMMGADIILETTSDFSTNIASSILLQTSGSTGAELGIQSSIILDTDIVYVRNGALRIQNDRNNFLSGLTIYEITPNNFQINNSVGTLTLASSINNIILTTTQTQLIGIITATQTVYPPTITNALGYQSNIVPYNYISTPFVPASGVDTYTTSSFTIAKRGMYYFWLMTTYSSPTTANVLYQSSYISTSNASNTKLFGSELTATQSGITAGGIQRRENQSIIWSVDTDATPFYLWIGNNTSGTRQNIGVAIYWTKIA
jgi:hypothetical protein